ncbi:hypothetical protein [Streptomyces sp. NPDC088180]|uniref:hypothetical protein n=1 Tax=Streptomyces sp. NPDC088180 TaxID=3365837 RepID=UPI00381D4431
MALTAAEAMLRSATNWWAVTWAATAALFITWSLLRAAQKKLLRRAADDEGGQGDPSSPEEPTHYDRAAWPTPGGADGGTGARAAGREPPASPPTTAGGRPRWTRSRPIPSAPDKMAGDAVRRPARGEAARQLRPLAEALGAAPYPRSVLSWLHRHSAADPLTGLAAEGQAVTHEMLDGLPWMKSTRHVRELLVGTGFLPARQENLARLEAWSSSLIGGLPAGQARLVGPLARWHVVRDTRRRAARGPYSPRAADADVRGIRIAAAFTAWLDHEDLDLAELAQADLDRYLTEHPTKHRGTRAFIRWAISRRLTDKRLTAAAPRRPFPSDILDTDEPDAQLSRCLNDTGLPREVRIAGALSRMYALPLTRIVTLTADCYTQGVDGHGYLTLERNPMLLPPKLARLVQEQITGAIGTSMISPHPKPPPFLMPGRVPSRHGSLNWLYAQMCEHGLPVCQARNTAMIEAVTRLPPIVVADLLGMHLGTADSWARYANASWAA